MSAGLSRKKIVLGITGGIAAYKSYELCRYLKKAGADVFVVMSEAGAKLASPLSFEALSGHPVSIGIFDQPENISHINLSHDADLIVVAPCTANTIAKFAHGFADNMLTACVLAAPCRVMLAPAMNTRMYENAATQDNLKLLKQRGFIIIEPDSGSLACGQIGRGRMREPEDLFNLICETLSQHQLDYKVNPMLPPPGVNGDFNQLIPAQQAQGLKVVITAGPTEEPIDPVRFISNRSSGRMGYALAAAAAACGAEVTLISGPVKLKAPDKVRLIQVQTAEQMLEAVQAEVNDAAVFIGCAAVADYHVKKSCAHKITKEDQGDELKLHLVRNPDIIAYVGALRQHRPLTVGFAAETDCGAEHAKAKLKRKHLDLIVLNDVSRQDIGFDSEYNAVEIFDEQGLLQQIKRSPKSVIAAKLCDIIFDMYRKTKA